MISVLVCAFSGGGRPAPGEGVVRTLAALIPVVVEGTASDVRLVGPTDGGELEAIADSAGCALLCEPSEEAALARALALAKRELALLVRAGFLPGAGFAAELADFAAGDGRLAALRETADGWPALLRRRAVFGLAGRTETFVKMGPSSLTHFARALRPRRRFQCGGVRLA